MDDNVVSRVLDNPREGRLLLSASLRSFISFFFWYMYRQEFIFKPFHERIIRKIEDLVFGRGEKKNLILNMPPRFGKLIADDTPVLTSSGWKRHGDLRVGDYVIGIDGKFKRVLAISPKAEANCCVEFSDGDKIYCHENHEWVIHRHSDRKTLIRETKWFETVKLEHGISGKRGHRYEYQLPEMSGILGTEKALPVKPYSLGAWLGDGTNTKPWITGDKNDYPIIAKMISDGYENYKIYVHKTTGVYGYVFKGLKNDLNRVDMCHWRKKCKKHIPEEYLTASEKQRLELLAGLLDTDGHLTRDERRYHFTTADESLRDSFIELISTFGWRVSVLKQEPRLSSSGIQGKHAYWIISFNPDRYIPCQLERKQLREFSKKRKIAFTSVTKGNYGKIGNCIEVEDGIYLVGKRLKPTHNSAICQMACAWAYMINPHSNCIYTSYSDDLTSAFSKDIRSIIESEAFKKLTGIQLNKAKSGADYWATTVGGGFRAASMGGSITGFGAGVSGDEFGGFLVIDDPNKASSVKSQAELQNTVDYYNNTLKSRLNNQKRTPILLIMQRLALEDLTGYLLENEKDDWDILKLQGVNEETGEALWEEKYPASKLLKLKVYNRFVYYGQYQQEPIVLGGSVIKSEWFKYYNPKEDYAYQYTYITSDTAQKKGEANDFSVFSFWGKTFDNRLHLLDMVRGKWEADELRQQVKLCWEKWSHFKTPPYGFYIEDKSSGIGVLQEIRKTVPIPLLPIVRARFKNDEGKEIAADKFSRVMTMNPYLMNGWVYLPNSEKDVISSQLLSECVAFKADLSHKHDDMVDTMCDAVDIAFGASGVSSLFI